MYIVAIAWIYVTLLMALTEDSFVAGVATFLFYGLFPLSILLWLLGTPERRRRRRRSAQAALAAQATPAAQLAEVGQAAETPQDAGAERAIGVAPAAGTTRTDQRSIQIAEAIRPPSRRRR